MTRALTLTQPWASLVALGLKRMETRSWDTEYRGPLLIHAAAGWSADDREWTLDLMDAGILPHRIHTTPRSIRPVLPLGAFVARCVLIEVRRTETVHFNTPVTGFEDFVLTARESEYGDFGRGRFAWLFDKVEPIIPPEPARGMLGLWRP